MADIANYGFTRNKNKYDLDALADTITTLQSQVALLEKKTADGSKLCPFEVGDVFITFSKEQPGNRWKGTSWQRLPGACVLYSYDSQVHPMGNDDEFDCRNVETNPARMTEARVGHWQQVVKLKKKNIPNHAHPLTNEVLYHHHDVGIQQAVPSFDGRTLPTDIKVYSDGNTGGSDKIYTMRALESKSDVIPGHEIPELGFDRVGDGVIRVSENMTGYGNPMTVLNPKVLVNGQYVDDQVDKMYASGSDEFGLARDTNPRKDGDQVGDPIYIPNTPVGIPVHMWRRVG